MEFDPREGVFHKYAREDYELPCRKCGNIVTEASIKCSRCGTTAPGIYSECPICYSKNYLWKHYGVHYSGALGGLLTLGPLGALFFGLKGRTEAECVCLNCGQGWMPFAFPGGKWNTTRKYKLKDATLKATSSNRVTETQADKERRRQAELQRRQELLREQERQRKLKEQERQRAKVRRRICILCLLVILCIGKFVSVQINANKDSWKIAYDNMLTSSEPYAPQQYYMLSDMNYDGIPELITYHYTDRGSSYLDICSYHERGNSVSILYGEYNVIPSEIGNKVKVFYNSEDESTRVYTCRMVNGQIDYSDKDTERKPDAIGLIAYEEGDIISGRYKEKIADLSYLEPPVDNEYWMLDMETAYDMLINDYSTDDLYRRLRVKKYATTGSTIRAPKIVFDASIMGYMGEMTYTSGMTLIFSWYTDEYLEEEIFMETYDLEKLGDIGYGNGYICYSWNDEILVAVNRSRKYGTQVDIRLK